MKKETKGEPFEGSELKVAEICPVSFAIFALARSHKALAGVLLRKLNLYPNQEIILMQLWEMDGQSEKALQKTLQVDHSTVAKSIKRMETAGLITTMKAVQDRRATLVYLTAQGRSLQQETMDTWAELERRTTQGMTSAERSSFVTLARKMEPSVRDEIYSQL